MPLKAYQFGPEPRFETVRMNNFLGVDFANDMSEVNLRRSPDAKNVTSSYSNVIEKRTGFAIDGTLTGLGIIHSMYHKDFSTHGGDLTFAHAGTQLWYIDADATTPTWTRLPYLTPNALDTGALAYPTLDDVRTEFMELPDGTLYFLGNKTILKLLPEWSVALNEWVPVCVDFLNSPNYNDAFIPTTVIGRLPAGGGTTYEAINMMQKLRKNSFLADASATAYQLDATVLDAVDTTDDYGWTLTGYYANYVRAQKLNADGSWTWLEETTNFTVNRTTGVVTFSSPIGVTPITGQDNLVITFAKTVSTYYDKMRYCIAHAFFGFNGANDYVFLSGNKNYPQYDFQGYTDDFYFPDTGYTYFGNTRGTVVGYHTLGDKMVILKDDTTSNSMVYLRSAELDSNDEVIFPMVQGLQGVGALAPRSIASLRDDPLWLSDYGVSAITSNDLTATRSVQDRGYFVNRRIASETNRADAMSAIHDNKYLLAFSGGDGTTVPYYTHIYVADPRKKYNENKAVSESWQYEWYYWELPIAITCLYEDDGVLYFGTANSKVGHFKLPTEANLYYDDDAPVQAEWNSPLLYMDDITAKKTLKNVWVRMVQYAKSSAKIYYRVRGGQTLVKDATFDMFTFEDIDFTRFTFNTDDNAEILVTNRLERQFMAIQFKIANANAEPFGILEITARYRKNSTYKGG